LIPSSEISRELKNQKPDFVFLITVCKKRELNFDEFCPLDVDLFVVTKINIIRNEPVLL